MRIDDKFLEELGLAALPEDEKKALIAQIIETLELRVGTKLAAGLSDAQLAEFEGFMNNNDQEGALKWLETNAPNYKDVVRGELEALKTEIKSSAEQILQSSQAAHQQPNDEGQAVS